MSWKNYNVLEKYVSDIPQLVVKLYPKCSTLEQQLSLWKFAINKDFSVIHLLPKTFPIDEKEKILLDKFWNYISLTCELPEYGINYVPIEYKTYENYCKLIVKNPNGIKIVPHKFIEIDPYKIYVITFISIINLVKTRYINYEPPGKLQSIKYFSKQLIQLIPDNLIDDLNFWEKILMYDPLEMMLHVHELAPICTEIFENKFHFHHIIYVLISELKPSLQDDLYLFALMNPYTKDSFFENIIDISAQCIPRPSYENAVYIINSYLPNLQKYIYSNKNILYKLIQYSPKFVSLPPTFIDASLELCILYHNFESIKKLKIDAQYLEYLVFFKHQFDNISTCCSLFCMGFLTQGVWTNQMILLDVSDIILSYI